MVVEKCEYKIGDCTYKEVTETACKRDQWKEINPVNDFAESCFNDGLTRFTYKITKTDDTSEEIKTRFVYIKSSAFFETEFKGGRHKRRVNKLYAET